MRVQDYLEQIVELETTDGEHLYGWICGFEPACVSDDGYDHLEIRTKDEDIVLRDYEIAEITPSGWRKDLFTGEVTRVGHPA